MTGGPGQNNSKKKKLKKSIVSNEFISVVKQT